MKPQSTSMKSNVDNMLSSMVTGSEVTPSKTHNDNQDDDDGASSDTSSSGEHSIDVHNNNTRHNNSEEKKRGSSQNTFLASVSCLEAEIAEGDEIGPLQQNSQELTNTSTHHRQHNFNMFESKRGTDHFMDIIANNEKEQQKQQGLFGGKLLLPFLSSPKDTAKQNTPAMRAMIGSGRSNASDGYGNTYSRSPSDDFPGRRILQTKAADIARHFLEGLDQEKATSSSPIPPPPLHAPPAVECNIDPQVTAKVYVKDQSHQAKMASDITDIEKQESSSASRGLTNANWHQAVQGSDRTKLKLKQLNASTA